MGDLPPDLVADLRGLQRRPELHGSLWREPYLVEHTYGALCRLVRDQVKPPGDVLDLGCGTGYMALELARDGCAVVAIDSDEASIALARDASEADRHLGNSGSVSYEVADVTAWEAPPDSFDVVLASRVLHHVRDVDQVMDKVAAWLRPGGRFVAVEFAYDRFDRRCASWLYQMLGLLQASEAAEHGHVAGDDAGAGIRAVWESWWHDHEEAHELNTYDELVGAFRGAFSEQHHGWLPYLYWEVLAALDLPPERGAAVARLIRDLETRLIAGEEVASVLFSWVGQRPS